MAKSVLTPNVATICNLLSLTLKALGDKPTNGSVVGGLLNMVNMWVDWLPAILDNQEALDLVFQYRTAVLKNWVDVSNNRSILEQISSVIAFRALIKAVIDTQQTAKDLKEVREHALKEIRESKKLPVLYCSNYSS